ncbi:uncharacterized protein LOC113545059 [Pangasianodon hypophthalmus]|uniref:uncharacterized protein LOC113545059 n=1 Tax=Pangasianodon hypophthalmus TaxID=310915 RepID=UPI0023077502|nr:uncharacterized protein LOC113545059 [Pangasianodon hypophthalmus]XP_053088747.1 uncharacterized protein LOC113545059 [Pangasianodon hypophthalmus]
MSSLEKRQANRRGSTHGPRKCSDGISDTSSVGSFMDDTDREVSNLTDRAFRSLCIGEDAIYNDLEVSSPADQHKACAQEALQKKDLRTICQESSSHGIQYEKAERKSEVASTFQHSYVDVAQEHVLRDESLSYISNGSMEAMWQQKRSSSRVSSLIKAFSSGESNCDSGPPDTVKDKYRDFNNESWDKTALLSIQRELSEFSSGYHPNFKSGPLQSYGNHFHAVARMNTATSSKTKFKAPNTTNFFFHSEFSPFQLWKDYNRFPFERREPSGFVSATEFPRWYNTPLYKELTATHRISSSPAEGRQFTRRKIEDIAASQRSRSTVIQKASAIEKRCESEMASNCPPWKNNNFVRNKLPSNRPSTVSPTNEKVHRPDSSLLYHSRHTYEIQHKVGKVGSSEMSSRTTPFNITQLLTPVIPGRQETETSEILQFAHTPLVSECDSDLKPKTNAKQLRDSYKSKASSLLFNLKDNRKRVKSTYSPTKFKASEISDRNKQTSKVEGRESRLSETSVSKVPNQEHSAAPDAWELCSPVKPNYELSLLQTAEHKHVDKSHNSMTLVSQYDTANCNISYLGSQNNHPDQLTNRGSDHYELSTNSRLGNSGGSPVGHINDGTRTFGPTRLETENIFSKAQLPAHLSAEMSAKQTFCRREDAGHQNFKEVKNFVRKPSLGYINNQVTDETLSWKSVGPVNMANKEMDNNNGIKDALPYKGEIAALIEMDKQRKATTKQYLPSANESYTMRKETCINKENENVNGSWHPKDKYIQDTKSSFQTYADKHFSNKQVKDDHANTHATSQNLYEFQHNGLQKMASPPKAANFPRGSEITRHEKDEICLQRNMKHAISDTETEKDYSKRTQFLQSMEEKYRYNEGSVAYQPYKYDSNKQWHIATTENRHTMGEECMSRQLQQSEMKAEQPGESNYIHSLSRTSCIQQQSTVYSQRTSQRNLITEDRAKTEEHKPTYSIAASHKQGNMSTDINIPNNQRTLQNNRSQTRGDRFNINDILSVRDNEQAKRVRENKHSFNGRAVDPTKLENLTSPVTSDVAEDIAAKTEPSKVQSQTQQDGNSHCKHENANVSYGYVRKESHIPNDVKERSGKDIFISNENDKITPRAISYKEKGQTKQEILTSKLKAHAQKEISAIKEKGLTKHAIPSRNPVKQSTAVSNEKGQINQEVLSSKKEITAEKLNHLFQDITYSSVPLYKEQRNQDKDEPKYESFTTEKVELSTTDMGSEKDKVAIVKERTKIQMIKPQEEKITEVDKKNCEVQKFVKNYVHQPNMQSKENQLSKHTKDNEKERSTNVNVVANGTILAKCFSSSPTLQVFSEEESVKKEDKTSSNLPTTYTSNNTEYSTFKANGNESPKHEVVVKAATNHLALYNISEKAITLECSVNKAKEQLSNVNTDKPTADSNAASLKCNDLAETTKSKDGTRKENSLMPPNVRQLEMSTRQDKTPSDWTKDEVPAVEEIVGFTDTKTAFPNKQMANTEQEWEDHKSAAGGINENQTVLSESSPKTNNQVYCKPNTEPPEKETWQEKEDIQAEAVQTSKTNDAFLQQFQNTDVTDDTLKSSQNTHASKELGYQTTLSLNKAVSMKLDSSEENKHSLQQEPKLNELCCENSEVQATVSQLKLKIRHENQNQQMIRDKEVTKNDNQQLQDSERSPDTEHHNQKEKDFHEHIENTPTEKKQSNDDIGTHSSNGSKSPGTEHEKSEEKLYMPINTINSKEQQLSSHAAPDKSADFTNPATESHVIHIASKQDSSPVDEPVIYSICVSSTSEAVSEDEPIIYSISVSSLSDASMTTGPENQENSQKQLSVEQVEKDDKETFGNKNKESDFHESKEDSKEVKLLLNNDMAEQETVVRKYDFPASKDKLDYYRSTEVDNISSSYESLLAKNGLPNGDTIHLESDQKEQDIKHGDEKEESTHNSLQKIQNNTKDNDPVAVEKMLTSADFTKKHSPELRKPKPPEASPELLRNTKENHEQCVTHSEQEHQTANGGATQRADGIVYTDRNTKQDVAEKQEILMSKVVPVCEDVVDTQSAKQIMANGNVQLKENKQVGQKVQTMETGLKENDDDVVNKNTEMVRVKCENDTQLTAGFSSANSSNKSLNHSRDDSPKPGSKISTNDYQIRIKAQDTEASSIQNSQSAVNQTGNTKSLMLQYRTQEECERDALKQEKESKESLQTGDNKALQNNRKELVCKSEFPELEVKFMKSNEVKVSRVIDSQKEVSTFNNEQTKENGSVNQNQIKYAAGKTDQSVFTVPDIPLEAKEVHKNDIENQIKADTVSTRGPVPPNNVSENAQSITPATVTGTKASSAPGMTEVDLERLENEKWKREPAQKEREIIKDEITPLNKDPKTASSVIKGLRDAEYESSKSDKNLKVAKAQPQDKKDDHFEKLITDNTRKNNGQKEIKAGIGTFKESSDIIRWDMESSGKVLGDKHDQHRNVYHPQKDALPERKGNTYDGKNTFESNQNSQYHDTVLTKKVGTFTKTEVPQKEKKTTRPEISALADYARLRVISAEDDTITEKDLLQKMNTYQKYNLSAVEPQKVNVSMSVGDTEQTKQLSVNKKSENLNATAMPLQVQERRTYKITDEILAGHNQSSTWSESNAYPKLGSLAKSPDDRVFAVKDKESTKEKTLTNQMQSNTKKSLTAQDYGYSRSHEVYQSQNPRATHPVQTQIESKNDPKLKQPVNANMVERKVYPQVKNSQSVPQVSIGTELNNANRHADNQIKEEVKDEETTEELQYYIVNAMESETKPKNNHEPLSSSHKITSNKDLTEIHATASRSNTSSPAMGKPIMFRVKDNTGKTSSVTKTVRPRFHRSFSEEFRIGSPLDICSEKDKVEYNHETDPKESANSPVLHEQPVTSHRLPGAKEIEARNKMLSPGFIAPKEPRIYNRRNHMIEEDESRSLISTVSEDVEGLAASSVVMTGSRCFGTEHIRHTYARPESSCYERPESACSDMRPASKPPAVPPKTEKALRRAKRLTSRRIKKVEDHLKSDTPVQPETKSTRTVSSLPASPMVQMSTPQSVQASPLISHYHVEPNYAPPAPSIVAHSFPMTQRKLLQDPNSGQIFMVDMPVQVKTKTFFDPETGKYLQLNVRQRAQGTLSQPASVEVLSHPYVVYPGFLPMSVSVSSLPSVRSSSQMSAPATLTEEPNQLKANQEPSEQEICEPERHRNVQQHNRPVYRTREQTGRELLRTENVRMTPRQTHIITMSELEDFAVENT